MQILFKHPCNSGITIKRRIPQANSTKKRIDIGNGEFYWQFTSYEYHFVFHFNSLTNFSLKVSSRPEDPLDYSPIECEIIM